MLHLQNMKNLWMETFGQFCWVARSDIYESPKDEKQKTIPEQFFFLLLFWPLQRSVSAESRQYIMVNVLPTRPLELHTEYIIVLSLQMPHSLEPAVCPSLINVYFITSKINHYGEWLSALPTMLCLALHWECRTRWWWRLDGEFGGW